MTGIYKIENQITHHVYIGQSKNIEQRWKSEQKDAFNPCSHCYLYPLQYAFRKYGLDNFTFDIIEECKVSELNEKEVYWIKYYNSYEDGYNQTLGGTSASPQKINSQQLEEITNLLQTTELTNIEIGNRYGVSENTISGINTGLYWKRDISYPIRIKKPKQIQTKYCKMCGKPISPNATYCVQCFGISKREVEHPNKETLYQILKDAHGNFTQVGNIFHVTDNAVRKWCKQYNLPFHSSDYKN